MKNKAVFVLFLIISIAICSCDDSNDLITIIDNVESWQINPEQYDHFMSVVATTNQSQDSLNILGAFNDENIRGYARGESNEGRTLYFLLVYSNDLNEKIGFRLFEHNQNRIIGSIDSLEFSPGSGIGTADNPYLIRF